MMRVRNSLLLVTWCSVFLTACQTVPFTGRSQLQIMSEQQELSLGYKAYQDVLKKEKISKDPAINERVRRVGSRIAEATGKTDYQWEFKVIDDEKTMNAFCLPGGKVAVYTGILPIAKDDAGLAAIIGHEVAHAIARHGGERASQQLLVEGVTAAAVTTASDANRANLYGALLGAGATLGYLLPYSRLQESEADRLGLIFMAKAGYDPHAARDVWVRMAKAGEGKSKPPEFLSTHPADETRIRDIEHWLPDAMRYYKP